MFKRKPVEPPHVHQLVTTSAKYLPGMQGRIDLRGAVVDQWPQFVYGRTIVVQECSVCGKLETLEALGKIDVPGRTWNS